MSEDREKNGATQMDEQQREQAKKDADNKASACIDPSEQLPPIDFSRFIISLAHEALMFLGEIPHPETNKTVRNLAMAKQTIDIIGMLEEKTKGNLSSAEEQLMKNLLYELRTKFVITCKHKTE